MHLLDPCPPASDEAIARIQTHHGVSLPAEYGLLLKSHNGAVIQSGSVVVEGTRIALDRFLAVVEDPASSDFGEWGIDVVTTRLAERLADDPSQEVALLLPIALLANEDYVCLDFRKSRLAPVVVLWDAVRSGEWAPRTVVIAPSFTAFMDALGK